jgi:oligopeptide/dipeptide ABC transporter ATP-binding protein
MASNSSSAVAQADGRDNRPTNLVKVNDLSVHFSTSEGVRTAVRGVSFTIGRGERVAIVGESGSGKSVTALAMTRLIETRGGVIGEGSAITFDGLDVMAMSPRELQGLRGGRVANVFQDPLAALNPLYRVGHQVVETIRLHRPEVDRRAAKLLAGRFFEEVGLPRERLESFPHELSGGMRQRAMIAMALSGDPELLIADEPTTSLDVTIQTQIVALLNRLVEQRGLSVLLISHDLGVVAGFADRVQVMYAGRIVESNTADEIFARPRHPYTAALLDAIPRIDVYRSRLRSIPGSAPSPAEIPPGCAFNPRCPYSDGALCVATEPTLTARDGSGAAACHHSDLVVYPARIEISDRPTRAEAGGTRTEKVLLSVRGLTKDYAGSRGGAHGRPALDDVSFDIHDGEGFGIVGESGSGKSTLARCVARLIRPTSGSITFDGVDLLQLRGSALRAWRCETQMVFQDPSASLDPRRTVGELVREPLSAYGIGSRSDRERRMLDALDAVGLPKQAAKRYPREFSGGQRQRVAIARSLVLRPRLLICDEPVSSLDVSVRAQIINLLADLQSDTGLAYLFIAHNLPVVRQISSYVIVMRNGKVVESGPPATLYKGPKDPYTQTLLASEPVPDPTIERERLAQWRRVSEASA